MDVVHRAHAGRLGVCWSVGGVLVEYLAGCSAVHEVAVVAAAGVVAVEPGVGLGLELAGAGEAAAVERGAPALLEGGAVEACAHGVVVRAAGWDRLVTDPAAGEVPPEALVVLGPVVAEH